MATAAPTGAALPAEPVIRTERLDLWQLGADDAEFIVELLNDAAFLRFIGDKKVRDQAGAVEYIRSGPMASYERHGFGLLRVALHESGEPIGICGLLKRDYLDDADLGFALLARFRSQGYAWEAASAVLAHARGQLGIGRVLAITSPDNAASIGLLEKLGFQLERRAVLVHGEPELCVFGHRGPTTNEGEWKEKAVEMSKVKPIPEGYHTVTPYLIVENGPRLVAFMEEAFGAGVVHRSDHPDGSLMHADMTLGDSHVMIGGARPEWPGQPTSIYLYVEDCDATYKRALEAGGTSIMEPMDMFYGDRHGGVKDPTGNSWWMATHIEDVSPEELEKRAQAAAQQRAEPQDG